MRNSNISSLFFWALILCFYCFFDTKVYGQQSIDSTYHYYYLITDPKKSTDLVSGINYYSEHKKQALLQKDTITAIYDLRILAIGQFKAGFIYDSESSNVEALNLLDQLKSSDSLFIDDRMALYNELGIIYSNLNNYSRAIKIYDGALKVATKLSDSLAILNNKALAYKHLGRYELAVKEFNIVYTLNLPTKNNKQIARALDNLGAVQGKLNKPEGLPNLLKALDIRIQENDISGLYPSYMHLTEYYKDRNDKKKARYYANLAYEVANSTSIGYKVDALSNLLELNDDPQIVEFISLKDSIAEDKLDQENRYAGFKYDYEKEQRRTQEAERLREEQELETAKQRFQKTIYLFGLSILLLAGGFLIYSLRQRHKKEKLQEAYKTETRISKKVHDELANDVSGLMSFVQNKLQVPETIKTLLLNDLENVYLRTRDISSETGSIELKDFSTGLKHLLMQYNSKNTSIITNQLTNIPWEQIADYKKIAVYRGLQELMVNMTKHSEATKVTIAFKNDAKQNTIRYTDNGKGASSKDLVLNGLRHVENRMQGIGGTFSFETSKGNGFMASLIFTS